MLTPQPSFDLVEDWQLLTEFAFMRNALAAGVIVAVVGGALGWFTVLRAESFAGHTLSVIGFPGAAAALLIGVSPLVGLIVVCVAGALGIAGLSRGGVGPRAGESAVIGTILAVALASGFLFVSLYGGLLENATGRLFGTILGVTQQDVLGLLVVGGVALLALLAIGRPLLFASLDPAIAAARGVPVRLVSIAYLLVLALAVAAASQIVGSLLVFALLVTPAAVAQQLTARPGLGIALSIAVGVGIIVLGMSVAYFTVYPVGFFVTSLGFVLYVGVRGTAALGRARRRWSPG